ncbi:MAG: Biotin-requiring enzyme [Chloroflexota bacterium]|jgi:biotin carboxyl carrier protein|nr:Biotin-requiring enzyme [Chloroflexota bacterium]
MPERIQSETRESRDAERSAAERSAERSAIAGSITDLLPALIAKLGATGLAELEVRQDGLRVRLRRPADGTVPREHRAGDRVDRADRPRGGGAAHPVGLTAVGPGRDARDGREGREPREADARDDRRTVATSPAVGIFQPRSGAKAGTRVRAGDRLGSVDMLGVPQEVVSPTDGLVGASLVEAGDAVEFGQGLVVIEFASAAAAAAPPSSNTADS